MSNYVLTIENYTMHILVKNANRQGYREVHSTIYGKPDSGEVSTVEPMKYMDYCEAEIISREISRHKDVTDKINWEEVHSIIEEKTGGCKCDTGDWVTCEDCNCCDDVSQPDTFMIPFGDEMYLCGMCAEERGAEQCS